MIENRMGMSGAADYYEQFIEEAPCPVCQGKRLSPNYLAVTVGGINIDDFCRMSVEHSLEFVNKIEFDDNEKIISAEIIKEIKERLGFLSSVGLEYLTLARKAGTLSGGEQQRVAIARALINNPAVLFADEPSGNLDTKTKEEIHKLFFDLRDKYGQTVVIVTHDPDLAKMCDRSLYMIDGVFV